MAFTGAVDRYGLSSPNGYNIPRPKFLYYVNFVCPHLDQHTVKKLAYFIKQIDGVQLSYDLHEMNQYNKKRIIQSKITYEPLNMVIEDTIDNTAYKLVEAYNRYYFGDFDSKGNQSWNYDITSAAFEFTPIWGLKNNMLPNDTFFIERVEVYEFYDQTYNKINFIHPKFAQVQFQNRDKDANDGNSVNLSLRYEGVVIEQLGQPMTAEVAALLGVPFADGTISLFKIPGIDQTINWLSGRNVSGSSIFGNLLATVGLTKPQTNNPSANLAGAIATKLGSVSDNNVIQSIIDQSNVNLGGFINGAMGGVATFDPAATTGKAVSDVFNREAQGSIVRDVTTANITPPWINPDI